MGKSKIIDHDKVVNPLSEAYDLMVKNKMVNYTGPLLTSNKMLCVGPNIDQRLKKYKEEFENQGRTPLDIILSCAFQLGVQQGIYMCSETPSYLEVDDKDKWMFKREAEIVMMTKEEKKAFFKNFDERKNGNKI